MLRVVIIRAIPVAHAQLDLGLLQFHRRVTCAMRERILIFLQQGHSMLVNLALREPGRQSSEANQKVCAKAVLLGLGLSVSVPHPTVHANLALREPGRQSSEANQKLCARAVRQGLGLSVSVPNQSLHVSVVRREPGRALLVQLAVNIALPGPFRPALELQCVSTAWQAHGHLWLEQLRVFLAILAQFPPPAPHQYRRARSQRLHHQAWHRLSQASLFRSS